MKNAPKKIYMLVDKYTGEPVMDNKNRLRVYCSLNRAKKNYARLAERERIYYCNILECDIIEYNLEEQND